MTELVIPKIDLSAKNNSEEAKIEISILESKNEKSEGQIVITPRDELHSPRYH